MRTILYYNKLHKYGLSLNTTLYCTHSACDDEMIQCLCDAMKGGDTVLSKTRVTSTSALRHLI